MEQEEPLTKKFKHSIFSDYMYDPKYRDIFYKHWHNRTSFKSSNVEVIGKPFRVCKISNFIKHEDFMDKLKSELVDVPLRRNGTDLFQFEQSSDLVTVNSPTVKLFYETFQTDLVDWFEKFTKINLNRRISMSTSCYAESDYLLCHDDYLGDRKIAYVLYLSENWEQEDGGTLDLFNTDEDGRPKDVVKSILPEHNSLIFFEVVDNSFHQVAEVLAVRKTRWSVNGWFHGPIENKNKIVRPDPILDYINPEYTEIDLSLWVSKVYLYPGIVREIQEDVEQESFAFLSDFLKPDIYETLCHELKSESIRWKFVGPADIRNYEVAEEDSLSGPLAEFLKMFKSITIFQLLKNYTELDLVPQSETMNPKMTIELQRWSRGCYTLISDKANYQSESESDEASTEPGVSGATEVRASCSTSDPANNHQVEGEVETGNHVKINTGTEPGSISQAQVGAEVEVETEVEIEIEADSTGDAKKALFLTNRSKSDEDDVDGNCSTSTEVTKSCKNYYGESDSSDKIDSNVGCNTPPSSQGEDVEDEDTIKLKRKMKNKSLGSKKTIRDAYRRASPPKLDNTCSVKNRTDTDTDDSDVSDIGDYLSDPLDCDENSEREDAVGEQGPFVDDELEDEQNMEESGSLDVIMQFNTRGIVDNNETIDYVDLKENNGTLIHVPSKDNHLCLVYKTLGICRVHKYVNYSCKGYFYNLVCTYCE